MNSLRPRPDDLEASGASVGTRRRFSRWRAGTLILVHVLITVHVVHWRIAGRTLAPLELNEVMYTFELGIVTAGFIFMAVAFLSAAIVGRFFCSWGCHMLALQDLCAWILRKMRLRPRPIRSRVLLWVPVIVALYMFVWPQAVRVGTGRPIPRLRLATDADGWSSFVTENFWRNLPGPAITLLTLGICGFLIVYLLGSRSFCAYGCPYGAVFRLADRIAPGRIRVRGDLCQQCGTCTAVCNSHVRVHEELSRYGMVVSSACLKDLDCVAACPRQAVYYGFGRPAAMKRVRQETNVRQQYDFARWEEFLLIVLFACTLLIFRGLYDRVPFFMTIGLGAIVAYLGVVFARLLRMPDVRMNRWTLKQGGHLLGRGRAFVAAMVLFLALAAHSAFIRYHTAQGRRAFAAAASDPAGATDAAGRAIGHLEVVERWGLVPMERIDIMLAQLYRRRNAWDKARVVSRRILDRDSDNVPARAFLAEALSRTGQHDTALREFQEALRRDPGRAETHYALAGFCFHTERANEAIHHLREAIRLRPEYAEAHYDLGALLVELGAAEAGVAHLRRAVELKPDFGDAHYNLAVGLAACGQLNEADRQIRKAQHLQPHDAQTQAFRQYLNQLRMTPPQRGDANRSAAPAGSTGKRF